jgi:hypothetical protein
VMVGDGAGLELPLQPATAPLATAARTHRPTRTARA